REPIALGATANLNSLARYDRKRVISTHPKDFCQRVISFKSPRLERKLSMKKIKGLAAKVERGGRFKTPRRIYDLETKASSKSPQAIAEATLKRIAPELKIKPDLSQLKFDKVKESILGSHVLYQQYHAGKPISGAWIRVDIDKEGRIYNIHNDLVPEPAMAETRKVDAKIATDSRTKQLSEDEARKRAIEAAAPAPG